MSRMEEVYQTIYRMHIMVRVCFAGKRNEEDAKELSLLVIKVLEGL